MNKKFFMLATIAIAVCGFAQAQVSDKTCEKKGASVYPHYREKIEKPHYDCIPREAYYLTHIQIKFREGTRIRLRGGKLVSLDTDDKDEQKGLSEVKAVLKQYDVLDKIERHFAYKN